MLAIPGMSRHAPQKPSTYWLHPMHQEIWPLSATQDFLHNCRILSRKPWHIQWAPGIRQDATQLQHTRSHSTGLSGGTNPPGTTRAASLMLPRVNQDGKVTPVHAFPLNTEVGDDSMLHTTSTGKVSLLLIMCPRANSAWTISYVHSKCLQQTFK